MSHDQTLDHTTDKFVGLYHCHEAQIPDNWKSYTFVIHPTPAFSAGDPGDATRHSNTCLILVRGAATFSAMGDSNDISSAGPEGRLHSVDSSLTERQRTILNVIRASVTSRGYPPSIREIGEPLV